MTSLPEREKIVSMVAEAVLSGANQARACALISLSERTLQRWQKGQLEGIGDGRPARIQRAKNELSESERQEVLRVANAPEFGHLPPGQIVVRLADQGRYVASESSIYRVLKANNLLKHRSAQRPTKTVRKRRALSATAPGQLLSWDITYLPTPVKGIYFYLYLFMDVFSRKIVGWQVYESECSERAAEVMRDICERENIAPNQVVLHSDNGNPMKGATMLATLQSLGVTPSFSRPAVSNDNPFSESLFRTLKYRPSYPPQAFRDLPHARQWVSAFTHWYNHEHRHSAIQMVTPAQRHALLDTALLSKRTEVYEMAKKRHPERWSGTTRDWSPVTIVHLNPEKSHTNLPHRKDQARETKLAA